MFRNAFVTIFILLLLFSKSFSKEYKRIVSLASSVTESLCELGVDSCIKGITLDSKKAHKEKDVIGTLLDQDIEKIISINPDLIIATKDGNIQKSINTLKQYEYLGFDIYVMETSTSFEDICCNFLKLAEKLDKLEHARNIVKQSKEIIEGVYSKITTNRNLKLFWQIAESPMLYTAGNKSFINDYNYYTKTKNLYEDMNLKYFSVEVEDVVKRNPDIIMIMNIDSLGSKEKKYWQRFKFLNALKESRVFVLDEDDLLRMTPLTFAKSIKTLIKVIYEDI